MFAKRSNCGLKTIPLFWPKNLQCINNDHEGLRDKAFERKANAMQKNETIVSVQECQTGRCKKKERNEISWENNFGKNFMRCYMSKRSYIVLEWEIFE